MSISTKLQDLFISKKNIQSKETKQVLEPDSDTWHRNWNCHFKITIITIRILKGKVGEYHKQNTIIDG